MSVEILKYPGHGCPKGVFSKGSCTFLKQSIYLLEKSPLDPTLVGCNVFQYFKGTLQVKSGKYSLELGPQPQGVARADLLAKMRTIVACALDFIELFNKGTWFPAFETEAYILVGWKDFPRYANGEISAVIHPDLQDKDFQLLKPGDPVFQTFDGEDILHDGDDTFFPVFINEAAYYEKKTAFWKTKKETFAQPALQKAF
uniref:Aminoacylase 3 n=1 Tax=Laticauda laticaudata TaxID=8630 RepID=A0A8C5S497_LATLA